MRESPYSGILNMIGDRAKGQIPVSFRPGKVTGTDPLKVMVSETEQSGSSLVKNASIGELNTGDDVMLVPLDGDQRFLVLCKVVGV